MSEVQEVPSVRSDCQSNGESMQEAEKTEAEKPNRGVPMPDPTHEDEEAMADTERSPLCAWLATQTHDEVSR